MPIIKFPSSPDQSPFFKDIEEDGYHIFSLNNAKKPNFYPNEFPDYPGVKIKDLKKNDVVIVRVLFLVSDGEYIQVESESVDMEVVFVYDVSVVVEIMTDLPDELLLEKYDSLELYEEEILYKKR